MAWEQEREHVYGLFKWLIGTVGIGVVTLLANNRIQERQLEVEEVRQLGTFIEYAMNENVAFRRRFARYFATVTTSGNVRERWRVYADSINDEWVRIQERRNEVELALRDSTEISRDSIAKLVARLSEAESELAQKSPHRIDLTMAAFDPATTPRCADQRSPPGQATQRAPVIAGGSPSDVICELGIVMHFGMLSADELSQATGLQLQSSMRVSLLNGDVFQRYLVED